MIYVSTACIKANKISEAVRVLAEEGFKNIELSGGTRYYDGFADDLKVIKQQFNLNYRCHNYFPPPISPFVLNLASLDIDVNEASKKNIFDAIQLSKDFNSSKFGIHAGFFIDIKNSEIGKKISRRELFDKKKAKEKFYKSFSEIKKANSEIEFYIENNVVSAANYKNYDSNNLFMLVCAEDYHEMKAEIDFKLLLDVAHLKVSCSTLSLDFKSQFEALIEVSDYIHISDNDGLADLNYPLFPDGEILKLLQAKNLKGKDFTIEVYGDIQDVKQTYIKLKDLIDA
jgi:sugar phosphate isomerase/epimerase